MLVLQRFRSGPLLACGGMGLVQVAEDTVLGGPAVVKSLRPDVDDEEENARRFEHEIEVARALNGVTGVPRLLDDGHHDGERVAVFEHVDGPSLAALKKAGVTLPRATAVSIIVDVLIALEQVHALRSDDGAPRGLVHRDVSPPNILVDRAGRGWLIDFGISVDDTFEDTPEEMIVGKLPWMAPEQAARFPLDARADQFAAGIVLWELLTGRSLFRRPDDRATWEAVIACSAPHLADLCEADNDDEAGALEAIGDVVDRMLQPERKRRFADCADAAQALRAAARGLGPVVVPALPTTLPVAQPTPPTKVLRHALDG